jgi:hypothetical protein
LATRARPGFQQYVEWGNGESTWDGREGDFTLNPDRR